MISDREAVSATDSMSPLSVTNFVLRHRRMLFGLPVLAFLVSLAVSYVVGVGYASRSSFVPQGPESTASRISALAAQFALIAGPSSNGESVEFYAQLLRSRELLMQAVQSTYVIPVKPGSPDSTRGTLVSIWKPSGADSGARARAAVERLNRQLEITTSRDANTVTLVTRAESPALAVQLNRRLVSLVSDFNMVKRQSRAAAERKFIEDRLAEARHELDVAEDAERHFLEQNREYQSSPQLRFDAARLERRVTHRQEITQALSQSYEQARIEEVRDTPVITIIDRPEFSIQRARSRLLDAIVWALIAGLIALSLALWLDYLARERSEGSDAYQQFGMLLVTSPFSRLARRLRGTERREAP
jgi:uncharacterized protein involved in exopolysaccharide biosynthesis